MDQNFMDNKIFEYLYKLYQESDNCDFTLVSADGKKFQVHTCVIMARIPRFRKVLITMRLRGVPNDDEFVCKLKSSQLELLLQYAYLGYCEVETSSTAALELLKGATYLHMNDLIDLCLNLLTEEMVMSTAVHIISSGEKDIPRAALEVAVAYVLRNLVMNCEENEICKTFHHEIFKALLLDDKLHAPYEEAAWLAAIRWIEHDRQSRIEELPKFLQILRLGMMDSHFLESQVKQHPLVTSSEAATKIYDELMNEVNYVKSHVDEAVSLPLSLQPRIPHATIIAAGGALARDQPTQSVEVYDHLADCWVMVPELTLPRQLSFHSLHLVDNKLYVIGGINDMNTHRSSRECWTFDLESFEWNQARSMIWPRSHIASTTINGNIYAIGGRAGLHTRQNAVELFDVEENSWIRGPKLDFPCSDCAAVVLNGQLYVIGGFNGIFVLRDVFCFDEETQTWVSRASLSEPRNGLRCVAYRNHIFALGGFNGRNRLNSVERYSPESNSWISLTPMTKARSHFILECIDDRFFVFGGYCNAETVSEGEIYSVLEDRWYPAGSMNESKSGSASCIVDDINFSSRVLQSIANRDMTCLLRNPNITRTNFVHENAVVRLPAGTRTLQPAFAGALPVPWTRLFFIAEVEENENENEGGENAEDIQNA